MTTDKDIEAALLRMADKHCDRFPKKYGGNHDAYDTRMMYEVADYAEDAYLEGARAGLAIGKLVGAQGNFGNSASCGDCEFNAEIADSARARLEQLCASINENGKSEG